MTDLLKNTEISREIGSSFTVISISACHARRIIETALPAVVLGIASIVPSRGSCRSSCW